ncbi:hypothetical protein AB654_19415 [Salmonella enterica]|nr:hypothetical protein [Salmonella enterica]EBB0359705.1 hypothetical protein [Salmonella enterica subsp. enterica serovar Rubislaw]EBQ0712835.1 hypothetical protein [Salmonella enterica subsp. enterica]ECT9477973.1 hypothetical protein [Salmonella enterica subsp. enterica serovar Montevideo]EDJ2529268.1 hypothetical protein [Salmonella enterica subsp. enterica serovar Muenchen]HDX0759613.1 hypothetical protein [Salmonella enterica subsp. enterica serovar Typhimurium]
MNNPKSNDFFVKRLQEAAESMLVALNHYSYDEAVEVLDWLKQRVREDCVIKIQRYHLQHDKTFPVRIPPKRRLVYAVADLERRKIPG